jgi:EAL domain-containing protein (putative c-di-GMP-specific phosphodiesterase class I)
VFEITESNELFDLNASKSLLDKIRTAGFRVSLDDFGTEHSNMLRIRELPLDEIKIDRSLCGTILENEDSHQITLSVISIANALGVPTVAEGIEDADTHDLLRDMGCQIGQGFHLGRPMSIENFAKLQPVVDLQSVSSDE